MTSGEKGAIVGILVEFVHDHAQGTCFGCRVGAQAAAHPPSMEDSARSLLSVRGDERWVRLSNFTTWAYGHKTTPYTTGVFRVLLGIAVVALNILRVKRDPIELQRYGDNHSSISTPTVRRLDAPNRKLLQIVRGKQIQLHHHSDHVRLAR